MLRNTSEIIGLEDMLGFVRVAHRFSLISAKPAEINSLFNLK